jgi:hypothetical protein
VLGLGTRRLATVISVVVLAGFCFGLSASAGSASTVWGTAQEVPGTASLNVDGNAAVYALSCAAVGNCSAGGSYADGSGSDQAFVADEVNGSWGNAIEVPGSGTLNAGGNAAVQSLSCASAGNCSAGGFYIDRSGRQAFVADEVNGSWGNAVEVPGSGTLNAGGNAVLQSLSCGSAGNCSAAGFYADGSGHDQAFVADEVNGTWGNAIELPGTLNGGGAAVQSLSCASAGNCSAGGFYADGSGHDQAFVADEVNGTWGNAVEVPGSGTLNAGNAAVQSLSCAAAGNCSAGGSYTDGSGRQAFVADEVNGTWGNAIEVPGSGTLNASGNAGVQSLSCAAAGNCSAGGSYTDGSGRQAFVADEVNGTWGNAIEVPGSGTLNASGNAQVLSLSCGSAGNCSAGGLYRDGSGRQAFVADEVNGTWGNAIEVPGSGALNAGGSATVVSLSCGSAGNCSAGGYYIDGSGHEQAFVVGGQPPSQASATAVNLSASTVTYGNEQAEQVSVTVSSAGTPTGTVTVTAGTTTLCTITLASAAGSCTLQATQLPAGTYQITGSYSGDASSSPSVSPAQALTVSPAGSATALNLSAATVTYGNEQAEQVSVMVSSPGTPIGMVTVTAGTTTLCTVTLASGVGSCTLQATQLPAGTYQVTGSYSGDADASPSTSPAQALTVQAAPSLAILSPPSKTGPAGTLIQWKGSGLQPGLSVSELVVSSDGRSYRLGSYKASSVGEIYGQYVIPCTATPQTSWTVELSAPNVLLEDSFSVASGTVQAECTGIGAGLIPYPIHVGNPLTLAQLNADLGFLETTLRGLSALHLNTAQLLELAGIAKSFASCAPAPSWRNVYCGVFIVSAYLFVTTVEPAS